MLRRAKKLTEERNFSALAAIACKICHIYIVQSEKNELNDFEKVGWLSMPSNTLVGLQ
jgi:hypothetical protein